MQPLIEDLCLTYQAVCKQRFANEMIDSMGGDEDMLDGYAEAPDAVPYVADKIMPLWKATCHVRTCCSPMVSNVSDFGDTRLRYVETGEDRP
jgi:hypothetical protein